MNTPIKKKFYWRGTTNNGDPCKQVCSIIGRNPNNVALKIYKLVLSADADIYSDFISLREWKGQCLYLQIFAIRLTTLNEILEWLNALFQNTPDKLTRIERKRKFVENYSYFFEQAMRCEKRRHSSFSGEEIVRRARREIGYSPKTVSCDIYNHLEKVYMEFI